MITLAKRAQLFHGIRNEIDPAWRDLLAEAGIGDDNSWLTLDGDIVARGGVSRCMRIELSNGEVVYFKRYKYVNRRRLQFWMLPSKAITEVTGYQRMRDIGLPVPEVLGYGEQRRLGHLYAAYIVTREIPNTLNLEDYASQTWAYLPKQQRHAVYQKIAGKIITMLKQMHQHHFYHYDLKWRNILIQNISTDCKVIFIDCPRSRVSWLRPFRGTDMDLSGLARIAMFYLRRTEQLRLLVRYCGNHTLAKRQFRRIQRHLRSRYPDDPRPADIDYKLI